MTRPTPAVDQRAAQARDDADAAIEAASELPDVDREHQLGAVAVALLGQHAPDSYHHEAVLYALKRLAWLGAELTLRLYEQAAGTPTDEPIPLVPALDDIRLASDYPGFGG